MQIELTPKQCEFVRESNHRWNMMIGAVRSGKSHISIQYSIPDRIIERIGKKGINLILGATRENIERNVLEPMRYIWGEDLVGEINSRGIAKLFGDSAYCIGADDVSAVKKIRGSEVKYCYCDEVCDINEQVFDILKSRLSLPYSVFDGAANPEGPNHFVKKFIDTPGLDIFVQHYTIYDNPFLDPSYVRALEVEYAGTIYYYRYILGLWTQAEGLVYPMFAKAFENLPDDTEDEDRKHIRWIISIDYGTKNPFAALKWREIKGIWVAVDEYYYSGRDTGHQKTDEEYVEDMVEFCNDIEGPIEVIVDPSAASFKTSLRRCGKKEFLVRDAKNDVSNGIRNTASAINSERVKISGKCTETRKEFAGYVWDDKKSGDVPVKEDDHAMDSARYFVQTMGISSKDERKYESVFRKGMRNGRHR